MKKALNLLFLVFCLTFYLLTTKFTQAQNISNDNYIIQTNEIEQSIFPQNPIENDSGRFGTIKKDMGALLGFDDILAANFFIFSIQNNIIDYGDISPTDPVVRESNLTLSSRPAHGFVIFAWENHPLADAPFENLVPDATCDSGACSEKNPGTWSNNLTYGFGFRCENEGVLCLNFPKDSFKQFADESKNEYPQAILKGKGQEPDIKIKIIYKLNFSSSQPKQTYLNNVTFVVLPSL